MNILALDTATEACSVALWRRGAVVERFETVGRSHTERLLPMVQAVLAEAGLAPAQLDGFVCGIGPGSFAGVRIGVGLVKGMALALDRPAVGVRSLDMLAQAALSDTTPRVLAAIDARTDELYLAGYRREAGGGLEILLPPAVVKAEDVGAIPEGPWLAVGSGLARFGAALRAATQIAEEDGAALPRARHALALAVPEFEAGRAPAADALEPAYLRNKVALTLAEQAQKRAR